jgi:dTDP-4-amino-4,6-dideoxygalactose transaminase
VPLWGEAELGTSNAYLRLPLRLEPAQRDRLLGLLGRLGATGLYPAPLNRLPGARERLPRQAHETFPQAEEIARRLLTLPLHGYLTASDLEAIASALEEPAPRGLCQPVR